ncbi:hypothetical protein C4D60_Mb05t06540 [Musa balbisiana]|uniref:Thaumatin-like protein n=1 Tax=Musa balbisiana TaxID=52838 RepID=A0A4S8JU74_MUSBA|nr:hypothetical protein C4D60_Mb05t06540 [Musa balbisiana]
MDPLHSSAKIILYLTLLFPVFFFDRGDGTTFKFVNKCGETVWPGILSNAGSPQLQPTGFELASASSRSLQAPTGWSGRFWARTGCSASSGNAAWSCATGDCGSGQVECNGAGAAPPATLAEFTLASSSAAQDFYDVSLVDGYNLPVLVEASRGCAAAGCVVDMSTRCPAELRVGDACRSARLRPTVAAAIVVYSAPHSHPDVFSLTPFVKGDLQKGAHKDEMVCSTLKNKKLIKRI